MSNYDLEIKLIRRSIEISKLPEDEIRLLRMDFDVGDYPMELRDITAVAMKLGINTDEARTLKKKAIINLVKEILMRIASNKEKSFKIIENMDMTEGEANSLLFRLLRAEEEFSLDNLTTSESS